MHSTGERAPAESQRTSSSASTACGENARCRQARAAGLDQSDAAGASVIRTAVGGETSADHFSDL